MDKIKKNYQLVLILVLLVAFGISVVTRPDNSDVVKEHILKTRIDSLQNVIEDNAKLREEYELSITLHSDSISGLNTQINKNNTKLSNLKSKYNEAVDNIAQFNTNDITEFFSDRYE